MNTLSDIQVSIDIGCHRHSVAVGLPSGELLEEFDIDHRPEGFKHFFDCIEGFRRRHSGEVIVAMEGYNGWARPLDTMVRRRGYRLFNINNLKLARFKEIFPTAAKTDRIDARKGLELLQLQQQVPLASSILQEILATPPENEQLKRLTRRRRTLVNERVRIINRFQSDLQAICPGLLDITTNASNLWFLNFLTQRDDLRKLTRLQEKTIRSIRGIGTKFTAIITAWQKTAEFSEQAEWVGPMIVEDARRILELRRAIKALEAQCEALKKHSRSTQR